MKIETVAVSSDKERVVVKKGNKYAIVKKGSDLSDAKCGEHVLDSAIIKGQYEELDSPEPFKKSVYIDLEKSPKSIQRVDKDKKAKSKLDKDTEELGLQNFKQDLVVRRVKKSIENPDADPWIDEFLEIEKSIIKEMELQKAGKKHLPKGSERHAYTPTSEHGTIYIPVNRLQQVYQSDKAINSKKVRENKSKMKQGTPLDPIEVGYNYDVHDGHHRWEAAKELGHTHVPVKVVGQDADKVRQAKKMYREVWKSDRNVNDILDDLWEEKVKEQFFGKPKDKEDIELSLVLDINKSRPLNRGKLIKRRVKVRGKNGQTFYRMQWIDPDKENKVMHSNPNDDGKDHSSYKHDDGMIKEIEKRQSNRFPVRHVPVDDAKNKRHNYRTDKKALEEAEKKYHKGEELPPVRLNHKGEIVANHHLVDLAKKHGLSHVPAIFMGNPNMKKDMEDRYKDEVLAEEHNPETGESDLVPASMRGSGMGLSSDGTNRGQHMKNGDIDAEFQDHMTQFKQYYTKLYTKKYIMEEAERHGISWDMTKKDGTPLVDEKVMWMRAFSAIEQFIGDGGKFHPKKNDKDADKKMEQIGKDNVHKHFLHFMNKLGSDPDRAMEWARKNDIKWKEKSDPDANWMYAAMAIKEELAKGRMLNGVRTRRKGDMDKANLVISDAIREQVRALAKKHGKDAMEDHAVALGIDFDVLKKDGTEIPKGSPIRWMRISSAIQEHIAKGNEFKVTDDDYGDEGRIVAERGDYGDADLSKHERIGLDQAKHNSKKFEEKGRKWALDSIKIDFGVDDAEAREIYDEFVNKSRDSKLMYHFDPTELLDSGVSLVEQLMSDNGVKNDWHYGRVADREARESVERDIFGDDYGDSAEDHERPIYGGLDIYNQGLEGADHGSVALVMKDDVKKRTGTTPIDSASIPYGKEGKMVYSATDPHHMVTHRWVKRWKTPKNKDAQRKRAMESVISGTTNRDDMQPFESQIMGGIDFSKDVDHILIPNEWQTNDDFMEHHEIMKMFSEATGIDIKYH